MVLKFNDIEFKYIIIYFFECINKCALQRGT